MRHQFSVGCAGRVKVVGEVGDLIAQALDDSFEFGDPAAEDVKILVRRKPDVLCHRLSEGFGEAVFEGDDALAEALVVLTGVE